MLSFGNSDNLSCIVVANENINFGDSSFVYSPVDSNYTDYVGLGNYCPDDPYYN